MTWMPPPSDSPATPFVRARASRRGLMLGGLGLSMAAVAGCGESGESKSSQGSAPAPAAGQQLAKKSEIPVGGGKVVQGAKVVVTQPTAGTFAAVSAVCTHEGCLVSNVAGGKITCACHGSEFALDGTVKNGPAKKPLAKVNVQTSGDAVTTA